MALIECCECTAKISEFAEKCPSCGCPVSISLEKNAAAIKEAEQKKAEEEKAAAIKVAEKKQKADMRRQSFKARKKKIIVASCISAIILCGTVVCAIYYGYILPQKVAFVEYTAAIEEYNTCAKDYNQVLETFTIAQRESEELLATAYSLLESDAVPFDENTKFDLSVATKELENELVVPPENLNKVEEFSVTTEDEKLGPKTLTTKTSELVCSMDKLSEDLAIANAVNETVHTNRYIGLVEELTYKITAFENSVRIEQQITDPSEDFIIERLCTAPSVVNTAAVTEDYDPNGKLHKPGGYTSQIYFSTTLLPTSVSGVSLIDAGTDCGGSIEVYANKDDAEKRNYYLAAFDGSILDSGSHVVIGSIIIRTSYRLTATNQQTLTQELIDVFTAVE